MKVLGFIILTVALFALGWAIDTGFAWMAIDVIAGHDLSFREAAGAGLIMVAIGSAAVSNNP